jgi:dynein heavy chain
MATAGPAAGGGLLYDYQLSFQGGRPQLSLWAQAVPAFVYSKAVPYFQMLVPTVETVRVAALLDVCLAVRRPLLLVGE